MTEHNDGTAVTAKVLIAWIGTLFGSVTLSQLALGLTVIYTACNLYFLLRDKWWRERK